MKTNDMLKISAFGLAGLGLPVALAAAPAVEKPNIILIMADDMGWSDIGCYGGEINTPNIDSLAKNGIRFTQFYNCAKCAPTRASLLTGLYHHQTGIHSVVGTMRSGVTLGEVLKTAGYSTLFAGKWHAYESPHERGFDRSYALLSGAENYWNPGEQRPGEPAPHHGRSTSLAEKKGKKMSYVNWEIDDKIICPYTPDKGFYATDAFTDNAVKFLAEADPNKPFFLYVPYTAPHFPLQARPEDIAKYRGKYKKGWEYYRNERYKRQLEMGLIDQTWKLSPKDRKMPDWDVLPDTEKDEWDLKMAVYAGMIECMDRGIGKILAKLKELGKEENTLVIFLSDNGGCSTGYNYTKDIPPGPVNSYRSVDLPWANVSNTPYRLFKSADHEGGACTPMIASWPRVIKNKGSINRQVGHVMDFMATFIDISGAAYPETFRKKAVPPFEGKSLLPVFQGKTREGCSELYFQHPPNRAVRQGDWKAVKYRALNWELYDLSKDHSEINDVAAKNPEKLKELIGLWDKWADRVGADKTPFSNGKKTKEEHD